MVEARLIELVNSSVLEYENSRNPFVVNKQSIERYLQIATLRVLVDENIRNRAEQLGIKSIDALHVACAEASQSDYFITCDRRLINRCHNLSLIVINPNNFIFEVENEN
ncbi:MAG: PIN domain-containing protein [Nostoc sp.]|uniref:PIN domain-containing protein n=1 Tax=Nostoc sp. TaxID=1180 RepID=UPI002FFA3F97